MSLVKSAATVGWLTVISRVLGFVRDMLVANVLGTGLVAEAFFVALRFPNLFRAMFAEGAFNAAFVPLFAKTIEGNGMAAAHAFAREVFSALLTLLVLLTAFAVLAMPLVMLIIAPGFIGDDVRFQLAVELTRITFPYLLFMSLVALQSGVLNSLNRFGAAAAAPILLNIILIVVIVSAVTLAWGDEPRTGRALAWGVLFAGLAQYLLLAVACRRAGMVLIPRVPRFTPELKRVMALSVPGIVSAGITQVNLLIATILATGIERGVSYLYYADRLYQVPLGVVGVAIGVVLLPDLSRKLRAGQPDAAIVSQNRALELSLFLTLPATIALMALNRPIVHTLFEHGAFTRPDALATAAALTAFAAGLPPFVLIKIFAPAFFAREDTRTPMLFAAASVAINIAAAVVLSRYFAHVGIAAATAIAAWVNAGLLGFTLWRRKNFNPDPRLLGRLPRIIAACAVMAAVLIAGRSLLAEAFTATAPQHVRISALLVMIIAGAGAYFATAGALKATDVGEFTNLLRWR